MDGDKVRVLAGGVDLVLKMRRREIVPEKVVSLQKVPGLDYVEWKRIGRFEVRSPCHPETDRTVTGRHAELCVTS